MFNGKYYHNYSYKYLKENKSEEEEKKKPTTECNLCLPMCNYFIMNKEGYPTKALTGKKQKNKKKTHTHTYIRNYF